MHDYEKIVRKAQELLIVNRDWEKGFADYANKISEKTPMIKANKKKINNPKRFNLYLYMNITRAIKGSKFDLRYLGQSVAELNFAKEKIELIISDENKKNNKMYFGYETPTTNMSWVGKNAIEFRRYFKENPERVKFNSENEEHRYESALLTELEEEKGGMKCKGLHNIQPVRIANIGRFQMKTPFKASGNIDKFEYKFPYGGNIDILARVGPNHEKGNKLCILEIKASNSKSEAKNALSQGLVYATFIRELLKSSSGRLWWNLFGYKGDIPKSLLLYVVCVMPSSNSTDDSFDYVGRIPFYDETGDAIELHNIYFSEKDNKIIEAKTSFEFKV